MSSSLRILLVDPDEAWLSQAKKFFEEKNYQVDTADTGKAAQLKIYNACDEVKPYFFTILNIEVKNHAGPQVMKFIKSKHPSLNVCIVLENDELLKEGMFTTGQLMQLGALDVIARPFELDDLLGKLEGGQSLGQLVKTMKKNKGISQEEEVNSSDESFSQIAIHEFFPNKMVLFDVFVKLNVGKYVKILHAGDEFSSDRIKKYREEKGVKELYFHSRDRKKYIRFCNHLAGKLISKNLPNSSKVKVGILKATSAKFLEEIHTEGLKPHAIQQGKELCDNMYNLIEQDQDLYKLMRDLQDIDPSSFSHSYLVSLFSSMIVKQFEWESKAIIESVAMAALFHDIGKLGISPELASKRPDEMTIEELEEYKKHPELGAEVVSDNKMISNSVKQIISQHHEYSDGSGFPQGLKDQKLLTLSKVVALADYFTHYIVENEVTPIIALKKVLTNPDLVKKFNGPIVEKFMRIFIDPGKSKVAATLQSNSQDASKKAS